MDLEGCFRGNRRNDSQPVIIEDNSCSVKVWVTRSYNLTGNPTREYSMTEELNCYCQWSSMMWRVATSVLESNLRSHAIAATWEIVSYSCPGDCTNWFELSLKVSKNITNAIAAGVRAAPKTSCQLQAPYYLMLNYLQNLCSVHECSDHRSSQLSLLYTSSME